MTKEEKSRDDKKTEANADFRISIVVLNVYLISQFSLFGEDLANKGID